MTEESPTTAEIESPPVTELKVSVEERGKEINTSDDLDEHAETEVPPTEHVNEEKPGSGKKLHLFNNPFAKGASKKGEIQETDEANIEDTTKGFGTIYGRIKRTASQNNIKGTAGSSPPPNLPEAITTEGIIKDKTEEPKKDVQVTVSPSSPSSSSSSSSSSSCSSKKSNKDVHELERPSTSANHQNGKLQLLLSRLFGGGNNKKKDELHNNEIVKEVVTDVENQRADHPLTRRFTGFFTRKLPSHNKKQETSDEAITTMRSEEDATLKITNPVVESTLDAAGSTKTEQDTTLKIANPVVEGMPDADGSTNTETITNKNAADVPDI